MSGLPAKKLIFCIYIIAVIKLIFMHANGNPCAIVH